MWDCGYLPEAVRPKNEVFIILGDFVAVDVGLSRQVLLPRSITEGTADADSSTESDVIILLLKKGRSSFYQMLSLSLIIEVMNSVDLLASTSPIESNDAVSEIYNVEAMFIREHQQ